MLSTPSLEAQAAPALRPLIVTLIRAGAQGLGPVTRHAGSRRDQPTSPTPPRPEERPLTFDDIARIGDTKADDDAEGEGQSSTKGTGSAG
jgi:hypothetical protein